MKWVVLVLCCFVLLFCFAFQCDDQIWSPWEFVKISTIQGISSKMALRTCILTLGPLAFNPLHQYLWDVSARHTQWASGRAGHSRKHSQWLSSHRCFLQCLDQQIEYLTWQASHFMGDIFKILTLSLCFWNQEKSDVDFPFLVTRHKVAVRKT